MAPATRKRRSRDEIQAAWDGAKDADITVLVVDAKRGFDDETRSIVAKLKKKKIKDLKSLLKDYLYDNL